MMTRSIYSYPAKNYFGVCAEGKTETETAQEGVACLASFIKEMGLPSTFAEMGIGADTDYRSVANSSNIITNGCLSKITMKRMAWRTGGEFRERLMQYSVDE